MSTPVEAFMLQCIAQKGDRYVYGAEADFSNPDPYAFDCSELVQWSAGTSNPPVTPSFPDGSWLQYRAIALARRTTSIVTACLTRGALLFRFSTTPLEGPRPRSSHVAISLGDGSTIEARGSQWGVGSWTSDPAVRRWTHAGLIPGVDYDSLTSSFRTLRIRTPFMRGVDVGYLQVWLNLARPPGATALVIDNVFGPATARAVRRYQGTHGLVADGIVGPLTWGMIES